MSSTLWYCSMAFIGVGTAIVSIYKKRRTIEVTALIAFYLFATSITWIGEFVALGIFNGYAYKPGLFQDPWAENLAAHLILNSALWPGAATLVVAFSLGYGSMALITVVFILIEYLFEHLGIYEQHWWKYYMSVIIVAAFLIISKTWYAKMNRKRYGLTRYVTFYFIALVILHLHAPLILLLGKQYYNLNLHENLYLSSTIFVFIYHAIDSVIWVLFVCKFSKWYWKVVPFFIDLVLQTILLNMNILIIQSGWNLFYTMFYYAVSLGVFIALNRFCLRNKDG